MKVCPFVLSAFLSTAHARPVRTIRNATLPDSVAGLKLDIPLQLDVPQDAIDQLTGGSPGTPSSGSSYVIIHLSNDSVAAAKANGTDTAPGQVKQQAQDQQASFLDDVLAADPSATVHAEVQVLLNAVIVRVDNSILDELGAHSDVVRVAPVGNYELDLSETVPYIGATAVQEESGYDGTDITVAVLDSGIDYTHLNLGGLGTSAAYEAAYGTSVPGENAASRDELFPTAKVVEGYDFVGEVWPFGPLDPDDDPIDFEGQ